MNELPNLKPRLTCEEIIATAEREERRERWIAAAILLGAIGFVLLAACWGRG